MEREICANCFNSSAFDGMLERHGRCQNGVDIPSSMDAVIKDQIALNLVDICLYMYYVDYCYVLLKGHGGGLFTCMLVKMFALATKLGFIIDSLHAQFYRIIKCGDGSGI